MHWGEKDNITLKNGSLVISVKGATVANPANGKVVKMAMQNYANIVYKERTEVMQKSAWPLFFSGRVDLINQTPPAAALSRIA